MLYVWSVFAITPSMFCDSRWSIRQMNKNEKECVYWHWVDIGRLLNLDITAHFHCYQDVLLFKEKYEDKHMKYRLVLLFLRASALLCLLFLVYYLHTY